MSERSILIVGATGGLGKDVVKAVTLADYNVHFTGRGAEAVADLEQEIPGTHGHVVDAAEEGAIRGVIEEIDQACPLAAYVHLAGGYAGGDRIDELDEQKWEAMRRANWTTLRNGASVAFGIMRSRKAGSIVTVGSIAAIDGGVGAAPYAVAKAAVVAFTRCLAEEGKSDGVRANCIIPGIINTEANRKAMPDGDTGSWVSTEQVARTIAFLSGPESAGINGSLILMKGGL